MLKMRCPKCHSKVNPNLDRHADKLRCPHCSHTFELLPPKEPIQADDGSIWNDGWFDSSGQIALETPPGEEEILQCEPEPDVFSLSSEPSSSTPPSAPRKKKTKKKPRKKAVGPFERLLGGLTDDQKRASLITGIGSAVLVFFVVLGYFLIPARKVDEGLKDIPETVGVNEGQFILVSESRNPKQPIDEKPADRPTLRLAPSDDLRAVSFDGGREQPGPWKAFPLLTPDAEIQRRAASQLPVAYNHTHYVVLFAKEAPSVPSREPQLGVAEDIFWRLISWKSGKTEGPLHWLGTRWASAAKRDGEFQYKPPAGIIAALCDDGSKFVAESVDHLGEIQLWIDGSMVRFSPRANERVQWVGWTNSGKLLTFFERGALSAWAIADKAVNPKAIWTIEGDKRSMLRISPGKKWLALAAKSSVLTIDPETGHTLGRLDHNAGPAIADIAVSPNGQQLAVVHEPVPIGDKDAASIDESASDSTLVVWDLATGKGRGAPLASARKNLPQSDGNNVRWIADNLLLITPILDQSQFNEDDILGNLYDVSTSKPLAALQSKANLKNRFRRFVFDRRFEVWSVVGNEFCPVKFMSPENETHKQYFTPMETAKRHFGPKYVQVAVDAGSEEISRQRGEGIAWNLSDVGVNIGPGGHTLRVRFAILDSDDTMPQEFTPDNDDKPIVHVKGQPLESLTVSFRETPIPFIVGSWRLFDETGKEYWSVVSREHWNPQSSQYLTSTEGDKVWFNFGNTSSVKRAIGEEILKSQSAFSKILSGVPNGLASTGEFVVPEPLKSLLERLEKGGLTPDQLLQTLKDINKHVNDPGLTYRQKEAIRRISSKRNVHPNVITSELVELKKEPKVDESLPILKVAQSEPFDFPNVHASERAEIDPWSGGVTSVLDFSTTLRGPKSSIAPEVTFAENGDAIYVADYHSLVKLDRQKGVDSEESVVVQPGPPLGLIIAVSSDHKQIICSSSGAMLHVDATDVRRQTVITQWKEPLSLFQIRATFGLEDRYLIYEVGSRIHVWDVQLKKEVLITDMKVRQHMQLSPDRTILAYGEPDGLSFLDLKTLKPVGRIIAGEAIGKKQFAFSADFSTIAWVGGPNGDTTCLQKIIRDTDGSVKAVGDPIRYHQLTKSFAVGLNHDGSMVAALTSFSYSTVYLLVWDTQSNRTVRKAAFKAKDFDNDTHPSTQWLTTPDSQPAQLTFNTSGSELAISTVTEKVLFVDMYSSLDELLAKPTKLEQFATPQSKDKSPIQPESPPANTIKPRNPAVTSIKPEIPQQTDFSESKAFLKRLPIPAHDVGRQDRSLSFDPSGKLIRVYNGEEFQVYDLDSGKLVRKIDAAYTQADRRFPKRWFWQSAISEDSTVAAFRTTEGNIRLVTPDSGVRILENLHQGRAVSQLLIGFSRTADRLFAESHAGGIEELVVWNVETGKIVSEHDNHTMGSIRRFARRQLLLGSANGNKVVILNTNKFEPVTEFDIKPIEPDRSVRFDLATFSESGRTFVTTSTQARDYFVWRHAKGVDRLKKDTQPQRISEIGIINGIKMNDRGNRLVSMVNLASPIGRSGGTYAIRIRDLDSDLITAEFTNLLKDVERTPEVIPFDLSSNGQRLAVLTDKEVLVFNTTNLAE